MKQAFIKAAIISGLLASVSQGATLTFTNAGAGIIASGFGDSAGNISSGLVWGIVVDTSGNGFATGNWNSGFALAGGGAGIVLQAITGGATDDVLYINSTVTSNLNAATDGAAAGTGRVNSITSVNFDGLVTGNQSFAIIWFDRNLTLGATATEGSNFGLITQGTNGTPAFVLPSANGATVDYSAAFAGVDPAKSATFVLAIPEPSAMLLGAFGALGLLRRRRR